MNVAFKHLEAKLRFGELSVGQWAAVLGGVLFALVFAQYLSPIGGLGGVILGVYLGAIPASAAFFASLSEFDLWGLVAAAVRWHRRDGRYVPGAGESAHGYALLADDGLDESASSGRVRSGSWRRCGRETELRARPASCSRSRRSTAPAWWSPARARSCASCASRRRTR